MGPELSNRLRQSVQDNGIGCSPQHCRTRARQQRMLQPKTAAGRADAQVEHFFCHTTLLRYDMLVWSRQGVEVAGGRFAGIC